MSSISVWRRSGPVLAAGAGLDVVGAEEGEGFAALDGEVDVLRDVAVGHLGGGHGVELGDHDADDVALGVEQGATGVAGVHGGGDLEIGGVVAEAGEGAEVAGGEGGAGGDEAGEGVAVGDDAFAAVDGGGVAEGEGWAGFGTDGEEGEVAAAVGGERADGEGGVGAGAGDEATAIGDDVVVGEDAAGGDDEAGTAADGPLAAAWWAGFGVVVVRVEAARVEAGRV